MLSSFGYKEGPPPPANAVFDVRFLKNPYWVEELRPLTGLDKKVQDYVLSQECAQEFLASIITMLDRVLPHLAATDITEYAIAFGCTGGQHRSATLVEALADHLQEHFPGYAVKRLHRELDGRTKDGAPS